jgi:hypothetical protein
MVPIDPCKGAAAGNGSMAAAAQGAKNVTAAAPVAKAVQAGRLLRRMLMGECCSPNSLPMTVS